MAAHIHHRSRLINRIRWSIVVAASLLWVLFAPAPVAAEDHIILVKPQTTGTGSGDAWENATTLQDALGSAGSGDEIWVATGVYTPGTQITSTFVLTDGVALFGGFVGMETVRETRDWLANHTVLSGDLFGDDRTDARGIVTTTVAITGTNAMHVVTGSGVTTSAVLDGFYITAGAAFGVVAVACAQRCGGGLYNRSGHPTIAHTVFVGNDAQTSGGGIYNIEASSPTLTQVAFTGNTAGNDGGGMANEINSSPVLTDTLFLVNQAGVAGAMSNDQNSHPHLTNVMFRGNHATAFGGAMINFNSSNPLLVNVEFSGNTALQDGGAIYNSSNSSPILTNVTLTGNHAGEDGGAIFNNLRNDPLIQNSIFWGNTATTGPDIFNADGDSNPVVRFSVIENGVPAGGIDGGSNLGADPLFVRPVDCGSDGVCGNNANTPDTDESADDDYGDLRVQAASPALDSGDTSADVDGSGVASATINDVAFDIDGQSRVAAVLTPLAIVDRGIHERQNQPPSFASTPPITATEQLTYTYLVTTTDDTLGIRPLTVLTKSAWLAFTDLGGGTAMLQGIPQNEDVGSSTITLRAQDAIGLTATQTFTLNVLSANQAPFFTSVPVTVVTAGTLYSATVTTDDPDLGDARTLSLLAAPSWLDLVDLEDGSGSLSGTPASVDVGDHAVQLQVQDTQGLTATQTFTLNVLNANQVPFFTSVPVTVVTAGTLYSATVTTDDPDVGDARTLSLLAAPSWLELVDLEDGSGSLSGTPASVDVGDHAVLLQVQDTQGLTATQTFTVTVLNANQAPFFTSVPVTVVTAGTLYSATVTTDDSDVGDARTLSLLAAPSWLELVDLGGGSGSLSGTPASVDVGDHAVQLQVQDTQGLTAQQTFSVTVSASQVATGSLAGQVTFNGVGVAGVTVTVNSSAAANIVSAAAVVAQAVTDIDGSYRFEGLASGSYTLTFAPPPGLLTPDPVEVVVETGKTTTVRAVVLITEPNSDDAQLYLPKLDR